MNEFLEVKCLSPDEQAKLVREIEELLEAKKKRGLLKDREVREIEEMRLKPLLDILDVQSVYNDSLYKK